MGPRLGLSVDNQPGNYVVSMRGPGLPKDFAARLKLYESDTPYRKP